MADGSSVAIYGKAETVYGVDPGGNGFEIPYVSETLEAKREAKESDETVASREIADFVQVDAMAEGSIEARIKFGGHDTLWAGALMTSAFAGAATVGPGTTFAAVASGNHITDSANGFASLAVGDWIQVSGFATAGNNGYAKIATKPNNGDITISGYTLVNESAGPSVTIKKADAITNGSTLKSFLLERKHADLANIFVNYPGSVIDVWDIKIPLKDFLGQSFGFKCKNEVSAAATLMGTPTAGATTSILSTVTSPTKIYVGGVATSNLISVLDWNMKVENQLRMREIIGQLGLDSIGLGDCRVTGGLKVYFATHTLSDLFLNDTYTSAAILTKDPATGKAYLFEFPSIKFRSNNRSGKGKNTDVIGDMTWGARKDPTAGYTVRIYRFN